MYYLTLAHPVVADCYDYSVEKYTDLESQNSVNKFVYSKSSLFKQNTIEQVSSNCEQGVHSTILVFFLLLL